MRSGFMLAGALILMTTIGARAAGWCSMATPEKSRIECGYSSATECENAIGKGGSCFVDPEFALNVKAECPNLGRTARAERSKICPT